MHGLDPAVPRQDDKNRANPGQPRLRRVTDLPAESQAFLRGLAQLIARAILREQGFNVPDGGGAPPQTESECRSEEGGTLC
jgi:hypothetical protein